MIRLAIQHASDLAAPGLDPRPRRKVAVLTCMDTRLDIFPMLGIHRGDAHIIRNAGGLVTEDVLRSLAVSQRLLGTEEIVVVMHDGCGLLGASEQDFADALAADGALPAWRLGAFDNVDRTLSQSLDLLRRAPALPRRGSITGFVFSPDTGALREVDAVSGAVELAHRRAPACSQD
jgi:carbonic anhydrase